MASSQQSASSSVGGVLYRRSPGGLQPESASPFSSGAGAAAAPGVTATTLSTGVRGTGGAITMERSEDEKMKYPDRINLDRKGLYGIPILEDEPALRLLSMQHNLIKRIQHLDSTHRLVFLDLYHNRLDAISGIEPLSNLRVLMLGKNRIRRVEGLERCRRLSVLDLHGNRVTQITGLENLTELKVLNLAGNLIRKVANLESLKSLEELNLRRNRIRSTAGLEVVPTLEKLYISNNEIPNVASLQKLDCLTQLHTLQMDGNPVWSSGDYTHHLVSSLPRIKVLDQQEVTAEVRVAAARWRQDQAAIATAAAAAAASSPNAACSPQPPQLSSSPGAARRHLLRRMEERNVSISNAKQRWNFLKTQHWKPPEEDGDQPEASSSVAGHGGDGAEEISDNSTACVGSGGATTTETTDQSANLSPSSNLTPSMSSPQLSSVLTREASRNSLKLNKQMLMGGDRGYRSSPGSPIGHVKTTTADSDSTCSATPAAAAAAASSRVNAAAGAAAGRGGGGLLPPTPVKNEHLRRRFPGLEQRRIGLPPQQFVNLHAAMASDGCLGAGGIGSSYLMGAAASSSAQNTSATPGASGHKTFSAADKKIGFFHLQNAVGRASTATAASDECGQSTSDEFSGGGLMSESSTDSSTSDAEDETATAVVTPSATAGARRKPLIHPPSTSSLRGLSPSARLMRRPLSSSSSPHRLGTATPPSKHVGTTAAAAAAAASFHSEGGRTSEQGRDFLIELDGDMLNVYGAHALKFLDRPWNRHRALKATAVQFNFVEFDELVPYLPKFRQTFSSVESFEFHETAMNYLGQLNALTLVQGISALYIGEEGNPIFHKPWKQYAIYRLQHWGLRYLNNVEVSDEDIYAANASFGCLGELSILVMPAAQLTAIARRLDLAGYATSKNNDDQDLMSSIRDANVREIIAKEALQYRPRMTMEDEERRQQQDEEDRRSLKAMENLLEIGHSAMHKLGRLEEEWVSILPILIKRIVAQYSDIRQYKKESLGRLERTDSAN